MKINHKLIFGSGARVIALLANVIVGLFLMPIIVHSLGDRIYGYWTLAASILGYYGLMDLGIVSAVQYHVATTIGQEDTESANKSISTAFFAFALLGILILLVTVIVSSVSGTFIKDPAEEKLFSKVILITGFGFALGFPSRVFVGVMSANLRFDLISLINLASLFVRTALIICVLKWGYGIIGVALVTSIIEVMQKVLLYPILKRIQNGFRISIGLSSISELRKIFDYSIFNFLFKIARQLRFYIQAFIVSAFIGLAAVTHYAIASRLSLYFMNFMISSFGLLSPVFSQFQGRSDNTSIQETFVLGTKLSVCIATFVASSLILYGDSFIIVWMGNNYLDAYAPLVILTMGMFLEVSQFPSVSYLQGVAKNRFLAYTAILEGTACLVLGIYLGRNLGLIGVAFGSAIPGMIMKLCIQPSYVCRNIGISLRHYYIRILGFGILVCGFAVIIPWIFLFRNLESDSYLKLSFLILSQVFIAFPVIYMFVFDRLEKFKIVDSLLGDTKLGKIFNPRPVRNN